MKRVFLFIAMFGFCFRPASGAMSVDTPLPGEDGRTPAIVYDYFPDRMYAFVWRNWSVVPAVRLAHVLGTSVDKVEKLARSMGLPKQPKILSEWSGSRGYITVLRRNWHLLPYDQLTELLGVDREELKFRLIEDDFLYVKLGNMKPYCEPLRYHEPTDEMRRAAARLAADLKPLRRAAFGRVHHEAPRFDFIRDFDTPDSFLNVTDGAVSDVSCDIAADTVSEGGYSFGLRMIFPYFSDYGDPLLDSTATSFSDGSLARLSSSGVNAIWVHSVLRMMVPPDENGFPGDADAQRRINGLKKLVARAARYGIRVYLYVNEPRAMDAAYFESDPARKELGGVSEGDLRAFCPSNERTLKWLSRSMEHIFSEVDGLGGVFTITASENLTTCVSHGRQVDCPRCSSRPYAEILAEVNRAIAEGVKRGNPDADVIVWDWGWRDDACGDIISRLPSYCRLMSVSEWSLPIVRGGIESNVGEYSLSSVGPGPRALRNWEYARRAGLGTVAKVQVNCSWEIAAVPSVPVLDLVAQHAENLSRQDVDGVMLSWTLGGYPSENLKLFQSFRAGDTREAALASLADSLYGLAASSLVREAWRACSESYSEYPYHISTLYNGPQHMGPANPFYLRATGYRATMVGLPYDDVGAWCSIYPSDVWISQMERCAMGFARAEELLAEAEKIAGREYVAAVSDERLRCGVVKIHLMSAAVQARFVEARNRLAEADISAGERAACIAAMREACLAEQKLITELLPLVRRESTVGYESSNHYFYIPLDLAEAYLSICDVLRRIEE